MPLLTLSLKSHIVESRAQIQQVSSDNSPSKFHIEGSINDFPSLTAPLHQLRIIEQCNGDQITYRYELDSPELELLESFVSNPITSNRQNYIENIYREIESRWLSDEDDVNAFTAKLRAFGGHLFDELLPEKLKMLLWRHHSQLKSIMVLSTEPFIPWELLHLKQPGQKYLPKETLFLGQMGLVRWLYGTYPPRTIKVRKGRVDYIIPRYPDKGLRLPEAEQEFQFLEQKFQAKAVNPKSSDVLQLLESGNFDLLHFAGHGIAEHDNIYSAKLLMQGQIKKGQYYPDELSVMTVEGYFKLKSEDNNRPMIILNACQIGRKVFTLAGIGGFAQVFLNGGAGAFVGPLWSVKDKPARVFTETLYKELINNLTLSQATVRAREQARQFGDATWLAYAVYGHPHLKINLDLL